LFEPQRTFKTNEIDVAPTIKSWSPNFNHPEGMAYWTNMQRCMWYSIQQANILKEVYRLDKNIEYDYIIKHRFDLNMIQKIRYENLESDFVYSMTTPHDGEPPPQQMRDWCVIGNNQNMNVFSSVFLFIKSLSDALPQNLKTNESYSNLLLDMFGINILHLPASSGIIRP